MSARRRKAPPDIDQWIREHGLNAEIDRIVRTCGFDRVLASITAAPGRFRQRREELPGAAQSAGPGRPKKRDAAYREALVQLVEGIKRNSGLDDDKACRKACRVLDGLRKAGGDLDQLGLAGLAELKPDTLIREYKRNKPQIRSINDAAAVTKRKLNAKAVVERTGVKAKAVTVEPVRETVSLAAVARKWRERGQQ